MKQALPCSQPPHQQSAGCRLPCPAAAACTPRARRWFWSRATCCTCRAALCTRRGRRTASLATSPSAPTSAGATGTSCRWGGGWQLVGRRGRALVGEGLSCAAGSSAAGCCASAAAPRPGSLRAPARHGLATRAPTAAPHPNAPRPTGRAARAAGGAGRPGRAAARAPLQPAARRGAQLGPARRPDGAPARRPSRRPRRRGAWRGPEQRRHQGRGLWAGGRPARAGGAAGVGAGAAVGCHRRLQPGLPQEQVGGRWWWWWRCVLVAVCGGGVWCGSGQAVVWEEGEELQRGVRLRACTPAAAWSGGAGACHRAAPGPHAAARRRRRLPPHPSQLRKQGPAPTLTDRIAARGAGLFVLIPITPPPELAAQDPGAGGFVKLCTPLHNERLAHMMPPEGGCAGLPGPPALPGGCGVVWCGVLLVWLPRCRCSCGTGWVAESWQLTWCCPPAFHFAQRRIRRTRTRTRRRRGRARRRGSRPRARRAAAALALVLQVRLQAGAWVWPPCSAA
jgi:hypothetical protein